MKNICTLILAVVCLAACASPGTKYYTKVNSKVQSSGVNGPKMDVERQTTKPILVAGSDFIGDQKVSIAANGAITHEILTPRAADGSILIEEIPILNKSRTAILGYHKRPMVAQVNTSSVILAWAELGRKLFSGVNNFLGTFFLGLTGLEAAKQSGAVGTAAVQAVSP